MKRRVQVMRIATMSFLLFYVLISGIGSPSVQGTNLDSKSSSPTYVSGGLYAGTIWNSSQSPVVVTADVVLFPDYTLTIEPGVEVLFCPNTSLAIRGTLNATGMESLLIRFTCPNGTWQGIKIETHLGGKATIRFAVFYNASTAIRTSLSNPESPVVEIYDTASSSGYMGFFLGHSNNCTLKNNTASECGWYGFYLGIAKRLERILTGD